MTNKVIVKYHGKIVGTLASNKDGEVFFQYDQNWINNGFSISPFSLPLKNDVFPVKSNFFEGLHGVFADSLPDSWGKFLLQKYLRKQNISNITSLEKLTYIGTSGMGALEYFPYKESFINEEKNIDLDKIQKTINDLLDSKEIEDIEEIYHLGSSSGGARPKILAKLENEDFIIKFSSRYDSKEKTIEEYNYSKIAKSLDMNVPNIKLINTKHGNYFAIQRFDRVNNEKVHMISVAALLECDYSAPCLDYRDLFKLTKFLSPKKEDILELFRRMVFNVVFENMDDHSKNFSFVYNESKSRYELSPFYDITKGTTYYNEHTTSVNGKGKDILDEDLLLLAKENGIDTSIALQIINKTKNAYSNYLKTR